MNRILRWCLNISIGCQICFAITSAMGAEERISLDRATIVTDADQPPFVAYGIEEVSGYLKDVTGTDVSVVSGSKEAKGTQIVVGPKVAAEVISQDFPSKEQLGAEGYLLKTVAKQGQQYVIVAGATPRGTKAGLAALMKVIEVEGKSAFVPATLNLLQNPKIATRGMHFNGWAFTTPYSFRDWSEKDWQKYIDTLAYQGVNLFYLWPFIEIMPVPLSPEDQEYLEECRRVVDYAQKKHGMEVWIMQCTNRVAKDDCGVKDPRKRPYWRPSQEDLNPGNPEHFKRIVASRDAMYKIVNNVNGVCNIDSDPGYYPHSPLSEYLQVLNECRSMLDKYNVHGKETKIISWMWEGWGLVPGQLGSKRRDEHEVDTIHALQKDLAEPWGLVAGRGADLPFCRKENVLQKTVLLPYGVMEGEPAYPTTNVNIDGIRNFFQNTVARNPELAGVMGNLQTPVLQFPHMFYFTECMADPAYRAKSEREVLFDVSGYLYPEHKQLLADSYLALKESDPTKIESLAGRLNDLVQQKKLGRLGIFGRKLFPDGSIVAKSLVYQLNLRAATERLANDITPSASEKDCGKLLANYLDAFMAWDTAHGWHKLWGWKDWPYNAFNSDQRFATSVGKMYKQLGDKAKIDPFLEAIAKPLLAKYDASAVTIGCITPFKEALLNSQPIASLAQRATATASAIPDPKQYPVAAANDGYTATMYWPGALVQDNTEWLQLNWDQPQTVSKVIVRFIPHASLRGRTIHLQREVAPQKWEDFATTVIPNNAKAKQSVATFELREPATLDKLRIVNLLDLYEVEAY